MTNYRCLADSRHSAGRSTVAASGPPLVQAAWPMSKALGLAELKELRLGELKEHCRQRNIETIGLLERSEFVEALVAYKYYYEDEPATHVQCSTCGSGDDCDGNEILLCDGNGCSAAFHVNPTGLNPQQPSVMGSHSRKPPQPRPTWSPKVRRSNPPCDSCTVCHGRWRPYQSATGAALAAG